MDKFLMLVTVIITLSLKVVSSYPYDHREDTVLPFSLSPGNVNLETYYLDKYPQPGVPGGSIKSKPTPQMKPALDPVTEGGNTFLVQHQTKDPHAMFRTRRAAYPNPPYHHGGGGHLYQYPNHHDNDPPSLGVHNHGSSMGGMYGLYNEENLHLQHHPRYTGDSVYEQHHPEHNRYRNHHQQRHHSPAPYETHPHYPGHGR